MYDDPSDFDLSRPEVPLSFDDDEVTDSDLSNGDRNEVLGLPFDPCMNSRMFPNIFWVKDVLRSPPKADPELSSLSLTLHMV